MDSSLISGEKNLTQNIVFNGSDKEYSIEILGQEVTVNCSSGNHNHGSSKVKLTDVVDYNWELRFYVGQLLAVHLNGHVIAYGMKGKKGGMIRVTNLESNRRALIREMNGLVQDISFALIPQQIVLGCVDEEGSLFVYNIEDRSDAIECTLLMHVVHPTSQATNYRVIWCPYVPSYGEDSDTLDDPAKLLALLNGSTVEVWDVSIVNNRYGTGPLQPHTSYEGYVEINGHALDVVDASFSPDGTALATASYDGFVKFFQVYMVENEKPRCLHEWNPHQGDALSCLLFLDNVHTYGPDSRFWKFAITGSNFNAELKIWSCESWSCLQTIKFIPNPNSTTPQLFLKVRLDMTGQYLLLSDINNRIMYVLQLEKHDSERVATVVSISEFLLPAPALSYCITSAEISKFRYTSSSDDLCLCEANEDETNICAIVIKLYVVQPKKLQECNITFQPESLLSRNENDVFTLDSSTDTLINLNENKVDNEHENNSANQELPKLNDLQTSVNLLIQQQTNQTSLNLMTPDAFSSPIQNSPTNKRNSRGSDVTSPILLKPEKISEDTKIENLMDADNVLQYDRPLKENYASAGSSPSREVQEILSFKNSQEYFESLNKIPSPEIETKNNCNQTDNLMFNENSNEVVWPNIPIMKANEIVEEENRKLAAAESIASENRNDATGDRTHLQEINLRLSSLESLIREQHSQIQKLQQEVKFVTQDFKSNFKDDLRGMFAKELDVALSRSQIQQAKLFENYVNIQKSVEQEDIQSFISSSTQMLTKQVTEKLQIIIGHDIKNIVLPPILNTFENLKHQLLVEYSQKLSSTDHLLKDNISKLVTSKAVADSLSLSIVNIIKPSLEECYKEMMGTTLIPSWERVCGTMFQQIHDTFTKGTKEYTASVESYMDKQRHAQDKGADLISQMQRVSDNIKKNADKLPGNVSQEIEKQLNISFSNMQERLTLMLANLVSEQVKLGFKNHAAIFEDSVISAVRSRAVTPSPHLLDSQAQLAHIQQLLNKGQIDVAFQQALSASDLSLVVHVCEKTKPQEVFKIGSCLLAQPVILSLIQQLSADLVRNTELKQKYIEEAVLSLEPTNLITKEHMPIVLKELQQNLNNFISSHPAHSCVRNMRRLHLMTQSLLSP
ncbi:hypothetical protein RI129_004833 [Pyrocoelia pectoralis]|uniref:Enhancer of mRNA-decapping protein 4 n=1 Tax=Pyrocoelia pectoralis TaxID=417401 RepID=A0AAN7VM92_9COLE